MPRRFAAAGHLLTVRTDDAFSDRVSDILNRHSPVDIEERAESWRQAGWRGFDERAEHYAADRPATPTSSVVADRPGEMQRDWEVRQDYSGVPPQTGRNYVRIYPPVEAPLSDKR